MPKKYNILKKSDIRRFTRDLEKEIEKQIRKGPYELKCSCGCTFKATPGIVTCPRCGTITNVTIR